MPLPQPDQTPTPAETAFEPLADLAGLWTEELAERFLPIPGVPAARYECIDGRLVMTPAEVGANSYGEAKLIRLLGPAVEAAGLYLYGAVNLSLAPRRWIQPDVTVLHTLPRTEAEDRWIPAALCTMVVEFVSPGSRQQDFVDKPRRCAEAGVPYFMRVELVRRLGHASVALHRPEDGAYQPVASAVSGQRLRAAEPFEIDFDPRELLP
ncbi:MAG TPA: Uma2 family endonuclease [Pilimelia sp.]|nr:Uma2 family endonuclease [Pilimelia sp.]